eukprot:COSAG02_NODE_1389_length_12913_cov_414.638889_6_plen_90_part_00
MGGQGLKPCADNYLRRCVAPVHGRERYSGLLCIPTTGHHWSDFDNSPYRLVVLVQLMLVQQHESDRRTAPIIQLSLEITAGCASMRRNG